MNIILSNLLKKYDPGDTEVFLKAKFVLITIILVILTLLSVMVYTTYLTGIESSIVITELFGFSIMLFALVLLVRGKYNTAIHIILVSGFATAWCILFVEPNLSMFTKMDTIVFIIGLLAAMPLMLFNSRKPMVLYFIVNIFLFFLFNFSIYKTANLTIKEQLDYFFDNLIVMTFVFFISFNLFSIFKQVLTSLKKELEEREHSEDINKTLFAISNAVNTTDNLDDLYRSIYDSLNHLIELPNFFIAIVDSEKKMLSFPFFVDEHDTQKTISTGLERYKESTSNTSRVISTKSPLFLKKDILQERLKQKKTIGTVSVIWIGVPLIVRGEVIGVMVVQHYSDPKYFTQKDLDLLVAVSDQVALAIDRKKAQEEIKQKEKITRTLFSISNAVNITLNLGDLYKQIHNLLGEIIDVTNFFIAILNDEERTLYFPYHKDTVDEDYPPIKNFNPTNSLTGLVISKRKPILLTEDELKNLSDKKAVRGTVSMIWMGVPLIIKDEVIGVITVQSYTDPYLYNKHDLEVLSSISDQVAIAIDRKRTEDELRKSEKKYRHLFNNAPAGMYEIDFVKQRFIEVNTVLCRYAGYSEDEFLSIDPLDLLTDKSKKQFMKGYKNLLSGKTVSDNVEYNILKKDGQKRCVVLNSDFIYKNKNLTGARVVVHDITERKRIEEMMIQSEKMMSVGGLAAGMAHEINNPLAGIMQNAQLVINRFSKSLPANNKAALEVGITMTAIENYMEKRKIHQLLKNIHKAGSNAAKIVDNMLSFARKGGSSKSSHNIYELLNKTLELAQSDYDLKKKYDFKQIQIVNEFEPGIPEIACEESKILQVLFNIIKNAAESIYDAEQKPEIPKLIFRILKVGNMARIEIEDNGPGMDDTTLKRVFEPFFTTKDVKKGTGLGLSLSYFIIVDDHGGAMEAESTLGEGTKFIIKLPF